MAKIDSLITLRGTYGEITFVKSTVYGNHIRAARGTRKKATLNEDYVKISFRQRESIYGLFLKDADYNYLKAKNFWRIVTQTHLAEWHKSGNINLAKIFSGTDFAKLSLVTTKLEQQ